MEYIKLSNWMEMPQLGYGVFLVAPDAAKSIDESLRKLRTSPR